MRPCPPPRPPTAQRRAGEGAHGPERTWEGSGTGGGTSSLAAILFLTAVFSWAGRPTLRPQPSCCSTAFFAGTGAFLRAARLPMSPRAGRDLRTILDATAGSGPHLAAAGRLLFAAGSADKRECCGQRGGRSAAPPPGNTGPAPHRRERRGCTAAPPETGGLRTRTWGVARLPSPPQA